MLRSAGLQPGWRVLDAGCGTGGFLPTIAELLGADGRIDAIDLLPEHIETVRIKNASGQFACPVQSHVADVTAIPFDDATFDAIWSANVAQYLTEAQSNRMLCEFQRVLKPNGLLALKDGDITGLQIFPIPPTLLWRLLDAWYRRGDQQIAGLLGSLNLSQYVVDAGFSHVSRRITFIERGAPLRRAESQFVGELVAVFAGLSSQLGLPEVDICAWHEYANLQSDRYILKQSSLYLREAAVLVTGYGSARLRIAE
jgi:ubiquinone/menaquinone biosynthesis C-methylase UbiE